MRDLALLRWDLDWKEFQNMMQEFDCFIWFMSFSYYFFSFEFLKLFFHLDWRDIAVLQASGGWGHPYPKIFLLSKFENRCMSVYHTTRIRHNNAWVETSFELIVTEYDLTNTGDNSPILIEVLSCIVSSHFWFFLQEGDSFSIVFQVEGFELTNNTRQTYSWQQLDRVFHFSIILSRQSSFVAPDRGIIWLSPYDTSWKPTFDIEPLLPIAVDAPTRPDNWRVRLDKTQEIIQLTIASMISTVHL